MRKNLAEVAAIDSLIEPKQANASPVPELVTAAALYAKPIVRPRVLLADASGYGILVDGLTMLVARPKAGKSWFTLQCGIHVAGGPGIQGVDARDAGLVLYGALEEGAPRTKARVADIAGEPGEWANRLCFFYELLPLMGGGAEQIENLIERMKPRAVFLDTLTALIKGGGGKRETDVFRSQYAEVSALRKIAERFKLPVVLIHHVRKGTSDSAIEAVAGTGGISAAIDCLWLLKRKPEGEGTLEIVGREVEEKTLALKFGTAPFGWSVLGDDAALLVSADRRELLELLREDGPVTPAQIAAGLGKSQPSVRMMLKRMRSDLQVVKRDGKYTLPLSL